ncbi:MAG: hypothetical protein IJY42_04360, partial [Clostridia bacterium]|nr:hypothetical protein [Clostridia bacterium]
MKKRILAWILTLSMMFGLMASLPLTAGAAGATLTNNPDSGWDGTTATKPSGSGTKESPFLVTSAANLKWMSDNSGSGGASAINCIGPSGKQTVTADNPEVEVYFKQINDIDLNGHDLCAIGTYSAVGSTITKAQYFGGHYDGQGYTIKNGMFVSTHYAVNVNAGHNSNWSGGLFGNIWGATIENIVFDNI